MSRIKPETIRFNAEILSEKNIHPIPEAIQLSPPIFSGEILTGYDSTVPFTELLTHDEWEAVTAIIEAAGKRAIERIKKSL